MTENKKPKKIHDGADYYIDSDGPMVFTEAYHIKRGYCCQSGCRHCPYGFTKKIDPEIPAEWQDPWETQQKDPQDTPESSADLANYEEMEEEFYKVHSCEKN